jgi:hypothetical protein
MLTSSALALKTVRLAAKVQSQTRHKLKTNKELGYSGGAVGAGCQSGPA